MSKVVLKTNELKEIINIAELGATNNQLFPLSSVVDINLVNNRLTVSTTDGINYLYITKDIEDNDEEFKACINIEQFAKLVPKLTTEYITLDNSNDKLTIQSNGTYVFPLLLDEQGNKLFIENKLDSFTFSDGIDIDISDIKIINKANKNAVLKNNGVVEYTGYYFNTDSVITTDGMVLAKYKKNMFNDTILMNQNMFNLLSLYKQEYNIKFYKDNDNIVISNGTINIYGSMLPGSDKFKIDAINGLFNKDIKYSCIVNKSDIFNALNRLSIFLDKFDMNFINVSISGDKIKFYTKNNENFEECTITNNSSSTSKVFYVDILKFISIINQVDSNTVCLYFDESNFIKIIEGNITQLLAISE